MMPLKVLKLILVLDCLVVHTYLAPITTKTIIKSSKLKNDALYEVIGVDDLEKMELRVCGIDSYEDARYGCVQLKDSEDWLDDSNAAKENGYKQGISISEAGNILDPKDKTNSKILIESDYDPDYGDIIDLEAENSKGSETITETEYKSVPDYSPDNGDMVFLDAETDLKSENNSETKAISERENASEPRSATEPESTTPLEPESTTEPDGPEIIDSLEDLSELDDLPTVENETIPDQVRNEVDDEVNTDQVPTSETKLETETTRSEDDINATTYVSDEINIKEYEDKRKEPDEPGEVRTDLPITTTETLPEPESITEPEDLEVIDSVEELSELEDLSTLENEPIPDHVENEVADEVNTDSLPTSTTGNDEDTTYATDGKSIEEYEEKLEEGDDSDKDSTDPLTATTETKPDIISENDDEETTKMTEEKSIEEHKEADKSAEIITDPPTTTTETKPDIISENDDEETTQIKKSEAEEASIEEHKDTVEDGKPAEVSIDTPTTTSEPKLDTKPSEDDDEENKESSKGNSIEENKEPVGEAEVTEVSSDPPTKSTPIIWSNEPPSKQILPPELLKCDHFSKCKIIENFN